VRHVLCPKEEPYIFNHPPDVIAYVSLYHLNKCSSDPDHIYRLLTI
jgi:hypothetical protein